VKIAKVIQQLIDSFEKLPGIGPKTAQRLTFYLLHVPQEQLDSFAQAVGNLKKNTKTCSICFNVTEFDPCHICSDPGKDKTKICVVEQPLDILTIERADFYHGLYHVLHGVINPLANIGPEHIHIDDLLERIKSDKIDELIIATNPTMEGEATAMYIAKQIKQSFNNHKLKITRIGRGLPTGADIEYADEITLNKAFEGRSEF